MKTTLIALLAFILPNIAYAQCTSGPTDMDGRWHLHITVKCQSPPCELPTQYHGHISIYPDADQIDIGAVNQVPGAPIEAISWGYSEPQQASCTGIETCTQMFTFWPTSLQHLLDNGGGTLIGDDVQIDSEYGCDVLQGWVAGDTDRDGELDSDEGMLFIIAQNISRNGTGTITLVRGRMVANPEPEYLGAPMLYETTFTLRKLGP